MCCCIASSFEIYDVVYKKIDDCVECSCDIISPCLEVICGFFGNLFYCCHEMIGYMLCSFPCNFIICCTNNCCGHNCTDTPEQWSLDDLNKMVINDRPNVKHFSSSFCFLKTFPTKIFKLQNLETLKISYTRISNIPSDIGILLKLTKIDFHDNNIVDIHPNIGNLINLTILDISENRLLLLPESIGNLTNLSVLKITRNNILSLPESIGNLINLTKLDCTFNRLTELPVSISKLQKLKELDFRFNDNFVLFPIHIANINSLEHVFFSGDFSNDTRPISQIIIKSFINGNNKFKKMIKILLLLKILSQKLSKNNLVANSKY